MGVIAVCLFTLFFRYEFVVSVFVTMATSQENGYRSVVVRMDGHWAVARGSRHWIYQSAGSLPQGTERGLLCLKPLL